MRTLLAPPLLLRSRVLAACGGDDGPAGPPDSSHVGTYALLTVNGQPLPVTLLESSGTTIEIASGSITLAADERYSYAVTFRTVAGDTSATESTQSETGTNTRRGNAVTLRPPQGPTFAGVLRGDTLRIADDDLSLVFRR